nr:reverse transcriptase domain-containing protein [Tanacetum cinerariifolium]
MHLRCKRRDVPGSHHKHKRNKSMPRKRKSSHEIAFAKNAEKGTKLERKTGKLEQVLIKVRREVPAFFQNLKELHEKERFPMDRPKVEKAFQKMKKHIAELPLLTTPKPKEDLVIYLYAAREAISAAPEINYNPMEKLILALVHASRRSNKDVPPVETPPKEKVPKPWTLFTNGSSCLEGSGAGLILTNPGGTKFTYALRFEFDASNNEAQYEALVAGLRIAKQMDVKNFVAKVDSYLAANQINGSYIAKEQNMIQYQEKTKALINSFKKFSIEQVPRSENKKADALSKIASTSSAHLTKKS